jgi:hypothetical protein
VSTPYTDLLRRRYSEKAAQVTELKVQNQHYAEVIAKLQAELASVRGKGSHVVNCSVPGTFLRRLGSLWSCRCGQIWRLDYVFSYADDVSKEWVKVDG